MFINISVVWNARQSVSTPVMTTVYTAEAHCNLIDYKRKFNVIATHTTKAHCNLIDYKRKFNVISTHTTEIQRDQYI